MKVEFCDLCGAIIKNQEKFEFNFVNNFTDETNYGVMCESCFRAVDGIIKNMQSNNKNILTPLLYSEE